MDVTFVKDNKQKNPLLEKLKEIPSKIKNWQVPDVVYYFLILLVVGLGFYFVALYENGFSIQYGGDYSAQYIPMGYHIWDYYHEWINTGHFTLFDQSVYLGVNSIGSNAYYGLFSPFNLIIVLLPRDFVLQSMVICSIVKLACAGLFFSIYMKHAFGVKDRVARICGVAYGFAGWGAFYLWYNNYQDILVFFPIVLLGIERVLKDKKPWVLVTGVFLLLICNYVLAVSYIICGFIYAMFRFFQMIRTRDYKENLKVLGFGFIGFAGGILMSLFVFGPALMATLSSPKLDSYSYFGTLKNYLFSGNFGEFFKLLFSWNVAPDQHNYIIPERVYYPILEFFFPATTCRSLPTLQLQYWDFDDMAVSLWCYIPFIMFLVPALIQSGKEKKWSHYIAFALLVFSLFTPVMYYLAMGFTNGYARWTLFIATSLIAYVGIYIDKIPNVSRWHIHVGFAFAVIGIVLAWIITAKLTSDKLTGNEYYSKGHYNFMHRLLIYGDDGKVQFDATNLAFILELVYTLIVYLVFFFTYYKKAFHILATVFVSFEAVVMGNLVTWGHGSDWYHNNGYGENLRFKSLLDEVTKDDKTMYRLYASINDGYSENNGIMNNYSSANFFHSLYNFEVNDFTLWTGLRSGERSVGGNYRGKYQDLDNLLGVKYYFISKKKSRFNQIEEGQKGIYQANVPFDFTESDKYDRATSGDYLVYENKNLPDFGYSYSTLYDGEMLKYGHVPTDLGFIENAINLSTTPLVSEEDAQKITESYDDITVKHEFTSGEEQGTFCSVPSLEPTFYWWYTSSGYLNIGAPKYKMTHYKLGKHVYNDFPVSEIPEVLTNTEKYTPKTYDRVNPEQWLLFCTPDDGEELLFKAGTAIYSNAHFDGSTKYCFYFIGTDNKGFMCDSHDDDSTDNTIPMRGFYVNKDVKALAICGKYRYSYLDHSNIKMFTESKDAYLARRNAATEHPIENVKFSQDKFTFETHYDNNRFVLSRVAFDKGWKINAIDNDTGKRMSIDTYKGNGGFVSFIAPKGNYSYTMVYETPYLGISYFVSALATTSFFVSLVAYHIYQNKKKPYYLDGIYRENY